MKDLRASVAVVADRVRTLPNRASGEGPGTAPRVGRHRLPRRTVGGFGGHCRPEPVQPAPRLLPTYVGTLAAVMLLPFGCGTHDGPLEPTPTATAVVVTYPSERTLFIGHQVQFEASLVLSDGSTQSAENVTWTSNATAVATASASGLVTAVAAGEATISAQAADGRGGSVRIRVFPEFEGRWAGRGVANGCTATGDALWSALCAGFRASSPDERADDAAFDLTQSGADVGGVVDLGAERGLEVRSGEVSVDGTLRLAFDPFPFVTDGMELTVEVLSWQTRADTPRRMTGGFQLAYSRESSTGSAVVDITLEEVTRIAGAGN